MKRALVTGGTRGIGAAIANRLRAEGIHVAVTGRGNSGRTDGPASYYAIDFSKPAELPAFLEWVRGGAFDILINNAGINKIAGFENIALDDFETIQRVNLIAPFQIMQAAVPHMQNRRWGRIINIASIFSVVSKEHRASYSASKFGLDGMTAALAAEVAEFGILANCVSPGFIETELTRSILTDDQIAELLSRVPMKRLGKPEEVAALVCWLSSAENTFMSGQNLVIDGGFVRA